jgi:protein O-mannosyl-transferase
MARRRSQAPPQARQPATAAVLRRPWRSDAAWMAALAAVTVALYWPVHGFDFVHYDDVDYIRQNAPVLAGLTATSVRWAFTTLYAGFWIPLTWLSLMADAQLSGGTAGVFHVTNLLLHVANTLLLFALLTRATSRPWPSAFVAALFAVHPMHVESVAWVTERKDVLSSLFLFLTLWAYGRYARQPARGRYAVGLLVFTLGLMAKPMLTTVPALLLCVDLWPLRRFVGWPSPRLLLEKLPFLIIAIGAGLLTMFAGKHIGTSAPLAGVDPVARLATAAEVYVLYLAKTVWPIGLAPLYPDPGPPPLWRGALAALGVLALTAAALRMARARPYVTAGWLWYAIALLPVSGLVKIGPFAIADRFTYVPSIGLFVVVAWAAADLATSQLRQRLAAAAAIVVLVGAAIAARWQLSHWRDSVALFQHTIAVTGDNPFAQYMLGLAYAEQGRTDEAAARYTEAVRLDPLYAHAQTSLGVLLFERGAPDDAISHYRAALRSAPDDAYTHANLGNAYLYEGRHAEAIAEYQAALRIDPQLAEAHNSYGKALAATGRVDDAIAEYTTALRLKPDDAEAHNNLGNALAAQGQVAPALEHYAAALRIRPAYAGAHLNMASVLVEHGRFQEAVEHYVSALQMHPDDARVHGDLGNALAAQQRLDEAIAEYERALALDPRSAETHNNLANALAMQGRVDEALGHYDSALRLDPDYAEAHYNLAVVLAEHGRAPQAIAHYTDALRIKPNYAAAHTQLALALQQLGRPDEARAHLAEALRLDPGDAVARQALEASAGR